MLRTTPVFTAMDPRLRVLAWCLAVLVIAPELMGQTAWMSGQASTSALSITNVHQLSSLLDASSRVIADLRLDVLVCSASRPEIGVVAVMDSTGSEVLELGPRGSPIAAGDVVRIEGGRCLCRRREMGVEISRAPDLDNDGSHGLRTASVEVNLTAGLHNLRLDYFNLFGLGALELACRLPDGSEQLADRFLVRPGEGAPVQSNLVAGLNVDYYEGGWLSVPDFALLEPSRRGTVTNISMALEPPRELLGTRFRGSFLAPQSGKYVFNMESDDGSLLFLDESSVSMSTIRHQDVPPAAVTSLHAPMADATGPQWTTVEGRVVFASKQGRGLRLELRSPPDSLWIAVADGQGLDPVRILNSRIRVTGVGRALIAANREKVLGQLSTAAAGDVTILEKSGGGAPVGSTPTLVAVGQIQGLSKDEASRGMPVRIHGVVTCLGPPMYQFMCVQDETRGVFVRMSTTTESAVGIGQFCDLLGHTAPGDFAPIVVADSITVLGKGQMPSPARPTWRELINGSMDVQWVELQGLVTAVESNKLALLVPEGELHIEAENYTESQLKRLDQTVIRVRGVLFAVWNNNRAVKVGSLLMRNAIIDVDAQAPRDPFDVALKSWSELYQFDSRATPFQRVKVRGTVIYSEAKQVFVTDQSRGMRVSLVESTKESFGDEVEIVGYPDIAGPAPLLRQAILRKTGKRTDPTFLNLDGGEAAPENVDSTLVRISATLMGVHSEQDSLVLEMNAQGNLFLARMPDTKDAVSLRVGSQLMLTGVYVGKATAWSERNKLSGFELLLSAPSQLTVLSRPSWWTPQHLLVMVGLLLAVLALAAAWISQLRRLVERRTQQLHQETRERESAERERAVESERSRIARDLHDDLGSSLTEIGALASNGQRVGTLDALETSVRAIATKARGLVTALDIIVWAVDPEQNTLESVADYLSDFASDYLSHSGIVCRFDIPVALPPIALEGRFRHDLLLAVKETLNNIVRHAHATEVEFRIACNDDQLQIMISDNGVGFSANAKHGGSGLRNLPLRLTKMGGRYGVKSSAGNGTSVSIELSLAPLSRAMPAGGQS